MARIVYGVSGEGSGHSSRAYAMAELAKAGVQFYQPTEDEIAQWKAQCGHQLPVWEPYKKELAGSLEVFERLLSDWFARLADAIRAGRWTLPRVMALRGASA